MGVERDGGLGARATGAFAKMLCKQLDDRLAVSDIIDDSNLLRNNEEREDEVANESVDDGEGSGDE